MFISSGSGAIRPTRARFWPLHIVVVAALMISVLVGNSGGMALAQSGPVVSDPLTEPSLLGLAGEAGTLYRWFYGDDGFHIAIASIGRRVLLSHALEDALQASGVGVNQSIEVDAAQVDGNLDNAYGVACRMSTTGGYVLWAGADGTAGILKLTGDVWGQTIPVVHILADTTYHVRGDCNGDRLTLSVNGAKVAETLDSDYKSGTVGLFVATNETTGIDVAFSNLSITGL